MMEDLGEHPFNFRMDEIKYHINDLVNNGEFDHAVKSIKYIEIQYVSGINLNKIDYFSIPFHHLESYHHADLDHDIFGTKYPDGSKYLLIYELNLLLDWVNSKQTEAANKIFSGSRKKKYKDGASIENLALLLYFRNEQPYNHDFHQIAKDYNYQNGNKLGKVFSVFTNKIRRNGNCKELESQTQKLTE